MLFFMGEFVSEPITPVGPSDTSAMARGEPGLPASFKWRDQTLDIIRCIRAWKHSERESSQTRGELYLRRHYYLLEMSDQSQWQVYFTRQPLKSGRATQRWFLYKIESEAPQSARLNQINASSKNPQ